MSHAQRSIEVMKADLAKLEPQLRAAKAEAVEVKADVLRDKEQAASFKAEIQKEEEVSKASSAKMEKLALETQQELDKTLPALDEAVSSLRYLNKADIDLLRTMARPPSGVRLTMEAGMSVPVLTALI